MHASLLNSKRRPQEETQHQSDSESSASICCLPSGRVDSIVIDSDVTNYTLSSLFPATEYEISLSAVKGTQESKVVTTSVFTGRVIGEHEKKRKMQQPD